MTQQHGRRYEHTLAGEIVEATTDDVWVATVGYSGNSAIGSSDIVITVDPEYGGTLQYNIEAKKRRTKAGTRCSSVFAGSEDDETGAEELLRLIEDTPPWAEPIIVLSFNRRAPVVIDARLLATWIREYADASIGTFDGVEPIRPSPRNKELLEALAPRLTPSENISMVKPDTDVLASAGSAPPEGERVAQVLRLPMADGGVSATEDPFGDVDTSEVADD